MSPDLDIIDAICNAVERDRLVQTAVELVDIPSPTRSASQVADHLAHLLRDAGFEVSREAAGWPEAPAVVARMSTGRPGRTLQFNGHLDTVHLPFVPARVAEGKLHGSGASDMKGGLAAAVEAMRVLRDLDVLPGGGLLLTAHDLHEAPWGDGSQVEGLIDGGFIGDGVLLPEYLCDRLPVVGRGLALFETSVKRAGRPVHEVLGGSDQPSVIHAGAELLRKLRLLDQQLAGKTHPLAGRESLFVGQVHSGEIFNQAPIELALAGTRRWLPGTTFGDVQAQFNEILRQISDSEHVQVEGGLQLTRDAFEIAAEDPLVTSFQTAHGRVTSKTLPLGAKPFVDDGNCFVQRGGIPAITHGPNAVGAHTVDEVVPVDELLRVARVYALTALAFCGVEQSSCR